MPARMWVEEDLYLQVGGLSSRKTTDEYLKWPSCKMKIGDEITIRIVEKKKSDRPASREEKKGPPRQHGPRTTLGSQRNARTVPNIRYCMRFASQLRVH